MLRHPDILGAVAELHRNECGAQVKRSRIARRVARQTATTASQRRTRFSGRIAFNALRVRFRGLVQGSPGTAQAHTGPNSG
jgi:hypothetical protein